MKARAQPLLRGWMTAMAIVLLLAGVALELTLAHETLDARATLRDAVARASPLTAGVEHDDARLLAAARSDLSRHAFGSTETLLAARAEAAPTAETQRLASLAAAANGAFGDAARRAALAARLTPGNAEARQRAEEAVDAALLGRLRIPARLAGGGALAFLLVAAVRGARRRRDRRLLAHWLDGIAGRMSISVDGRRDPDGGVASADAHAVSVDVFLRRQRPVPRSLRTGPTMALVLSHGPSSTTLRLTPVHDVRSDAVRTRLKDATLARVLGRPGTWRIQARLDGRPVAESRLKVRPPVRSPSPRCLHLAGRA